MKKTICALFLAIGVVSGHEIPIEKVDGNLSDRSQRIASEMEWVLELRMIQWKGDNIGFQPSEKILSDGKALDLYFNENQKVALTTEYYEVSSKLSFDEKNQSLKGVLNLVAGMKSGATLNHEPEFFIIKPGSWQMLVSVGMGEDFIGNWAKVKRID